MKQRNIQDSLNDLIKSMSHCMQKSIEENPEESMTWTPEQLFEKGSQWAGSHILITEELEPK
jgi:hypothetical protein